MATSDSPLSVPNITLAVARPAGGDGGPNPCEPIGDLGLSAEPGLTITVEVAHLPQVMIPGQDFG